MAVSTRVSQALNIVTYRSSIPQSCVCTFIASPARKLFVRLEAFKDLGVYHIVTSDFDIFCDVSAVQCHNPLQNPFVANLILLAEFGNIILMVTILGLILLAVSDALPFEGAQVDDKVGTPDSPLANRSRPAGEDRGYPMCTRTQGSGRESPLHLLCRYTICFHRSIAEELVAAGCRDHSVSTGDGLDLVHHIGIPDEC